MPGACCACIEYIRSVLLNLRLTGWLVIMPGGLQCMHGGAHTYECVVSHSAVS
jgi:hypothetical protein